MALSLTWGGRADTNIAFSEFFAGNHTVAARFMLQFVNVYAGPMLAVHGGGVYFIGNEGGGNNKISIRIGSGSLDVPIPVSFQETWHHVAVARNGATCTVYLDGAPKGTLTISSSSNPSGTLRLGRSDEIHQQFYGFLDDVAVFTAALSAAQVAALAAATTLTGTEANLLAGFVFGDGPSAALPATLTRPLTYVPGARNVTLSSNRNNVADRGLLPLSLVGHMRLPFAQGQVANVVQGFANATGSHQGYAAFCYDFGFPDSDINGYVFKASSPGTVAHVREGGPNTSQGPSNFVTIEQGAGEFCDYLHLQQNSCSVTAGQPTSYGTGLAKVGRSGTGGPHLHQAVTNLGEHTTDRAHFVTIPLPICNYEYSDDKGATWHHAIRGYLKQGQWVRSPVPKSPVRYTAAWTPNTIGEYQIYDAPYAQYRARYDELWPQGWRLKLIDVIDVNGEARYTAAWEPSSVGEYQIYGATFEQFKARYDELWPQGWRLKFVSTYHSGGPRMTAAWRQTHEPESWVHGWEYADLRARYDVLWQQGWRLKLVDRFTV